MNRIIFFFILVLFVFDLSAYDLTKLNSKDINNLHALLIQSELERISPKLEVFRNSTYRYNIAYGGRGAGAKSWSFDSLIVQRANREKTRVACFREIQDSLKESSYFNIQQQVSRLNYSGWEFYNDYIKSPVGSYFIFKGLKDIKAANQVKSYESFDIFRIEEGDTITMDSWLKIMFTLRKKNSQFWITFNPCNDTDPVMELFINSQRDDCLAMFCEPENIDNPWWFETELPKESEELKKRDPDEWLHVFGGQPRKQGFNAVINRLLIAKAMQRKVNAVGAIEIGCDPARFGDDKTQIYKRHGFKVIQHKEIVKQDGTYIANVIWNEVANRNKTIKIKVDTTGIGASVVDHLRFLGAYVIPIAFNNDALNYDKYGNIISEMMFELPIEEMELPNDRELSQDLSTRLYGYDKKGRRVIESKDIFKQRLKRSPDKGDALCLCFCDSQVEFSKQIKSELAQRYK